MRAYRRVTGEDGMELCSSRAGASSALYSFAELSSSWFKASRQAGKQASLLLELHSGDGKRRSSLVPAFHDRMSLIRARPDSYPALWGTPQREKT